MEDKLEIDAYVNLIKCLAKEEFGSQEPELDQAAVLITRILVNNGRAILSETCEHEDMVEFYKQEGSGNNCDASEPGAFVSSYVCPACDMEFTAW